MNPNLNKQAQRDNARANNSIVRADTFKYLCKTVEVTCTVNKFQPQQSIQPIWGKKVKPKAF